MKKIILLLPALLFLNCKNEKQDSFSETKLNETAKNPTVSLIQKDKNTSKERFLPPENYVWVDSEPNSFGYFLENFKLKPYGTKILKYDGTEIATQNLHEAIYNIDTGNKDLQQCADAFIRLRAEYLWKNKRFDDIKFHFTNGDLATWNDYKNGTRAFINGNNVSFRKSAPEDGSYQNFRNYLDLIFNYSGTISLNKETKPVIKNSDLKTGDILITPGSPGHVVFIAGVSKNKNGEKLYLLGEGFTPAQSIHILSNPFNSKISPWYNLDIQSSETKTARYYFKPSNFRSF